MNRCHGPQLWYADFAAADSRYVLLHSEPQCICTESTVCFVGSLTHGHREGLFWVQPLDRRGCGLPAGREKLVLFWG